eukprot:TRINITY_DN12551_c0_g1_i1.p1 TRINITY_DN12551_c0_g1~~TRINITY_DN12551_c0_g1_i1.p1  ORF type:complete len:267 (-),score=75.08 TRINITY_DN12551_c0_g1_i1:92-892(-)
MSVNYSIVVPAYKEGKNLKPLVERIVAEVDSRKGSKITRKNLEIIVVDDNSRDGSEEVINKLRVEGYPCRIIVRTTERGLSSAVLRGFNEAQGEYMLCMDADLQHPPEKAPDLLEALQSKPNADFVIGTRYGEGVAIDKDWPLHRRIISVGARLLSRPLTPLSDPMTGFFGLKKSVFKRGKNISPLGFKIALELYTRCQCKNPVEVPFSFGVRIEGESKLDGKVIVKYLQQLFELYRDTFPAVLVIVFLLFLFALYVAFQILRAVF